MLATRVGVLDKINCQSKTLPTHATNPKLVHLIQQMKSGGAANSEDFRFTNATPSYSDMWAIFLMKKSPRQQNVRSEVSNPTYIVESQSSLAN